MKTLKFVGVASGAAIAGAFLAGCIGPQQPLSTLDAARQARPIAHIADVHGSWMLPEATNEDLLYVTNTVTNGSVSVYSYPAGKLVGTLKGFNNPYGDCADSSGDIFITSFGHENITEYAHGGTKPIKVLKDNGAPDGCAVNPKDGDLAVANSCDGPIGACYPSGTILVYKHGRSVFEKFTDTASTEMFYCAYDSSGNLFVDGVIYAYHINYAELLAGEKTFTTIALTLPKNPQFPGGLQWHNGRLATTQVNGSMIYQYALHGTRAQLVDTTPLRGVRYGVGTNQFIIDGNTVVAPVLVRKYAHSGSAVDFFRYPAGGKPLRTILKPQDFPESAAISAANHSQAIVR